MIEIQSLKEYADQILTDIESKTNQETPALSVAYNKIIANAVAAMALTTRLHNIDQRKECFPQTASEDVGLPLWADLVDRQRSTGTASEMQIDVPGTESYIVEAGLVWQADNGLTYVTTSSALIEDGVASVSIACSETGSEGTLAVDDELQLTTTVADLDGTATVTAVNVTGADEEELDDWRDAIIHKAAFPPDIGTAAWFYYQALTVDGITRAYPYCDQDYPGRVIIYAVDDDNDNGTPSEGQLENIVSVFDDASKNILWAYGTLPNGEDRLVALASPVATYILTIINGTPSLSDNMKTLIEDAIATYAYTRDPYIEGLSISDTGTIRAVEISSVIQNVIESNPNETGSISGVSLSDGTDTADYFILDVGTRCALTIQYS